MPAPWPLGQVCRWPDLNRRHVLPGLLYQLSYIDGYEKHGVGSPCYVLFLCVKALISLNPTSLSSTHTGLSRCLRRVIIASLHFAQTWGNIPDIVYWNRLTTNKASCCNAHAHYYFTTKHKLILRGCAITPKSLTVLGKPVGKTVSNIEVGSHLQLLIPKRHQPVRLLRSPDEPVLRSLEICAHKSLPLDTP